MRKYFINILVAIDILANTILAGRVRTISERIGEIKNAGKLSRFPIEWFVDTYILEPLDPGHSLRAYEKHRGRG